MPSMDDDPNALLTPGEVAERFKVSPRTVGRWARDGRIQAIRTLGGHRRFRASEVAAAIAKTETEPE
ncbi:MAG TPA: BldC family transcriptional regulator [Acidimicrobiia bacterium]